MMLMGEVAWDRKNEVWQDDTSLSNESGKVNSEAMVLLHCGHTDGLEVECLSVV